MNEDDPLLQASGLHKSFGHDAAAVHAVRDVDLTVRAGELIAVMGASGSGKSTLLHLLGGLVRPDSGSIRFGPVDLAAAGDRALTELRRRRIGIVYQAFQLMPMLTAEQNVALPLLLDRIDKRSALARAAAALAHVGLEPRRLHRPAQLSGGEQQRVAIARCLVTDPVLILADEPTGNLDRRNAQHVAELLRGAAAKLRAVVLVTHEPAIAAAADRIAVLADGAVVDRFDRGEVGSNEELAARYLRATETATAP